MQTPWLSGGSSNTPSLVLGLIFLGGWFQILEAVDPDDLKRPRQAPFCVDETNTSPIEKGLQLFVPIFTYHSRNKYVPVSNIYPNGTMTSPTGMLKNIEITPVHVKDQDSKYEATLKNWLHISIESHVYLEGLYIQALSSPWGVPFGEFLANFDCGDCASKTSMLKDVTNIIPCIHRGGVSFNHPNVLTIGGEKVREKVKFKQAHFHFRYTQYPCFDHTYAQIVAVRTFDGRVPRFETFWTPVFELKVDDNPAGAYYPFYYGWKPDFLTCHTKEKLHDFKSYSEGNQKLKIHVNGEFDHCVVKREGKMWYTCPPGPVKFTKAPDTLNNWKGFRESFKTVTKDNGNPTPNPNDAQLCYDAGQWDWNVGQSNWSVSTELVWAAGSLKPHESLEEDQLNETCMIVNGTGGNLIPGVNITGEVIVCTIQADIDACLDFQTSDCDASVVNLTYGKQNDGRTDTFNWDNSTLTEQIDEITWRWGKKYIFRFHGQLLIFSWVVAFNILAYIGRYLKEDTIIDKKSSYIGIGNWIWYHMMFSYIFIATAGAGLFLVSNHRTSNKGGRKGNHDLCNIHSFQSETELCLMSDAHKYIGYASIIGFGMSYFSGWYRARSVGLRKGEIFFHIGGAYIGKLAALLTIIITPNGLPLQTTIYIVLMEISSILMLVAGGVMTMLADKRTELESARNWFPVPEAIDTFSYPSYALIRGKVLPIIHIVLQGLLYIIMLIHI